MGEAAEMLLPGIEASRKLQAYLDTGFTPEQVEKLADTLDKNVSGIMNNLRMAYLMGWEDRASKVKCNPSKVDETFIAYRAEAALAHQEGGAS